MNRIRVGHGVAVFALVIASLYLVIFVDEETRLRILPWLWIAVTAGIGVTLARLDPASADRSFSLQVFLLCLGFTLLVGTILIPRDLMWAQNVLGGLMVVPLITLIWVQRCVPRSRRERRGAQLPSSPSRIDSANRQ